MKEYNNPSIEFVELSTTDIVTTSIDEGSIDLPEIPIYGRKSNSDNIY